jgi:hypothetical protein
MLMLNEQRSVAQPSSGVRGCFTRLHTAVCKFPFNKLRIPLVVIQILTQYIAITGVQYPDLYREFLRRIDVLNIDMRWFLSAGCVLQITFYTKLLLTTLLPLLAVAILGVIHMVVRYGYYFATMSSDPNAVNTLQRDLLQRAVAKHTTALLVFTFLIFPTVSTVVFQTFTPDYLDGTDQCWLRADYSVSCSTDEYKAFRAYAAVMILVYPIGIPALYACLLWRHRADIHAYITTAAPDSDAASLQTTRFLWATYKPKAYWWELVECLRRLLMTGFLVFILPGTGGQSAVACVFAVLSMVTYGIVQPLKQSSDAFNYTLGAVVLFMSIFISFLIQGDYAKADTDNKQNVVSVLMIALNVLLILSALVQMSVSIKAMSRFKYSNMCSVTSAAVVPRYRRQHSQRVMSCDDSVDDSIDESKQQQ